MRVSPRQPGPGGAPGSGAARAPQARAVAVIAVVAGCLLALLAAGLLQPASAQTPTLRQLASQRGLFVGAAVDANQLSGNATYRQVLAREYNSVTAENAMKWGSIEATRGQFNWAPADALVSFAQANGQSVYGHTLVWHSQAPSWINSLPAAELRTVVQQHITTQVTRYRGAVRAWDVVNEAFNEDGTLRQSVFLNQLGQSYIADAFRAARAADPNAKLYINDFNVEGVNAKSTALFNLVRDLRAQGVPIDGVGIQAHLILNQVPSNLLQNLQRFASLGVDIAITELDIRMQLPPDQTKLTQQANDYRTVLQACLAVPRCTTFTTWGFTDAFSWVPGFFSGQGAALPFNENFQPKPAYTALVQALGGPPPPTTTTSTTTTSTTIPPTTTTGPTTTTVPGPPGSCRVQYRLQSVWQNGFVAELTVTNTGTSAINGWTVRWSFNNNAQITNVWNATRTQTGQAVAATNMPYNAQIGPGGSQGFGFQASYSGSAPTVPTTITLNNTACTVV
jgi:endo-1,4-beta-xylanase